MLTNCKAQSPTPQIGHQVIECTLTNIWPLHFRFKAEQGITKSMLVVQRDENKWPGKYSKVIITMERLLNTSCRHKWAQGVSFLIPQQLGRIKYLNHFQVRVQTQITMKRVLYIATARREWDFQRFFILQPSNCNSVVWNTITRHFLWSIPYVIYNSYLRLLIWGRNGLMNFVLICWLLYFCFFHGMQWNLG